MRGVSRVSYYQDVKDSNIPVDAVKTRLDNICAILDINPPETIVYDELFGSFQRPRLLDNGRTIILYKSQDDSVVNWQICNLYHSLTAGKSPRWMIRHFDSVMLVLTIIGISSVLSPLFLSAAGVLTMVVTFAFLLLQFPYVVVGWFWRKAGQDKMLLWKETMHKAGLWPTTMGSNYEKSFKRILWMPFVLVIAIVYSILMYGL